MAISTKSRKKDEADAAPSAIRARRRRVLGAASLDLVEDTPSDEALQSSLEEQDDEEAMRSSVGLAEESGASATDDRDVSLPAPFPQFPLVRLDESLGACAEVELAAAAVSQASTDVAEEAPATIPDSPRKRATRPGKVRSDAGREQQRRVATAQRQRHEELIKTWMPTQRGANMTLTTRIGSQTVEGWFKRTFVRLSRMLYRIHTFPMQRLTPEAIARLEKEVLGAIGKAEMAISQQLAQCEGMLERVDGRKAFYAKHFELEVIVSTKTAMALHALYHRADELMLVIESLDFAGILTEAQRRKQIGAIHAAIFGLGQSIERLHRGLYVRAAQAVRDMPEVDAVIAAAAGGPVDLDVSDPATTCATDG